MKFFYIFLIFISFFFSKFALNASSYDLLLPSSEILEKAIKYNEDLSKRKTENIENKLLDMLSEEIDNNSFDTILEPYVEYENASPPLRPYAEFEKAKYFLMSARYLFGSIEIKKEILKNLPEDVTAIIITENISVDEVKELYRNLISTKKFMILQYDSYGNGFWARDNLPIPVYYGNPENPILHLINAKYFYDFEPDKTVSKLLNVPLVNNDYYFEGGNFQADANGNCFLVNAGTAEKLPDNVLTKIYGCKSITRLPFKAGIGHIDERIKIISNSVVLTDTADYKTIFEKKGYTVYMLPRAQGQYETYMNSLLINGTLFLPVFNESNDQVAIDAYKQFGFKVIPLNSKNLSAGRGSIHCITMTYPELSN